MPKVSKCKKLYKSKNHLPSSLPRMCLYIPLELAIFTYFFEIGVYLYAEFLPYLLKVYVYLGNFTFILFFHSSLSKSS